MGHQQKQQQQEKQHHQEDCEQSLTVGWHPEDTSSTISTVVNNDSGIKEFGSNKQEFVSIFDNSSDSGSSSTQKYNGDDYDRVTVISSPDDGNDEAKQKQERQLVRNLDLHIIPLFCAFYFVDFLDRANIGNATVAGLQKDIGMSGPELSTAISAFFITYIIFQVPSNIILKRIGARWWLSSIMLAWGLITVSMALVKNFSGLLITRLLLGAAESGYIPGILFQMSRIYTPQEMGFRVGILLCMGALSGIVSGPVAYIATSMEGKLGLHGWQYLFIIEGTPTVLLAFLSFWVLFDDVSQVGWLTEKQKQLQEARMAVHINNGDNQEPISLKTIWVVILDKKTWLFSAVFLLSSINLTSIQVFLPVMINGFGFTALTTQLLSAPPAVVAFLVILVCGYLADRGNKRAAMLSSGAGAMALGYTMLLFLNDRWACYAAVFIIAAGIGVEAPVGVSWSAINYSDLTVRAVAVAVVSMMGNFGNVIASFIYTVPGDTHHTFGHTFNLVSALGTAFCAVVTGLMLRRQNIQLEQESSPSYEGKSSMQQQQQQQQFRFFY